MTREQAAELRVQDALKKIESAQHLLEAACADLSAVIGAIPDWKRSMKLADRVHDLWRKLAYNTRAKWKLDHDVIENGVPK